MVCRMHRGWVGGGCRAWKHLSEIVLFDFLRGGFLLDMSWGFLLFPRMPVFLADAYTMCPCCFSMLSTLAEIACVLRAAALAVTSLSICSFLAWLDSFITYSPFQLRNSIPHNRFDSHHVHGPSSVLSSLGTDVTACYVVEER